MKKRYFIYLGLLILLFFGGLMGQDPVSGWLGLDFSFSPVRPFIQLPGEVWLKWGEGSPLNGLFSTGLTNTFTSAILAFIAILVIALLLKPRSRTADEVPTGGYNLFELIFEGAYNYVERSAGKWTKTFFPFFMTFILWILIANWMSLLPGWDSIGIWENVPHFEAEKAEKVAINAGATEEEAHHIFEEVEHAVEERNNEALQRGIFLVNPRPDENGENPEGAVWTIVPFVRPAASDLNFTLAIAIISVIFTQYYGMRAQGYKYWIKFFPFFPFHRQKGDEIAKSPLAVMDIGVGLLEFVSEVFKIVSFAFRLLGNIFAGMVLLFVIASLFPAANLAFYFLEFGVGALQAVVFALLTLTFMSGATHSHH
ncbi:MAG: F0F1 ATP synthase subunit A [Chloroflexi bacterium]|nr:F0F1 ATP synthase subunit A [Chloroflexota bacterium]